jgi:hypothetical protein
LLSLIVTSCGSNLFENADNTKVTDLDQLLNNASSESDFSNIIALADQIIDSSSSTDSEKQDTYYNKSEAILGQNNIGTLDLFADLASAADSPTLNNVLTKINLNASKDALLEAADAIKEAEEIGSTENITDDQHLLKGVINTLIIVSSVHSLFEVDPETGELNEDISSENFSWENAIEEFIFPNDIDFENTIFNYAQNAVDGFSDSGAFGENSDDNELNILQELSDAMFDVVELQNAIDSNDTYNSYDFSDPNNPNRETDIQNALNDIFGSINS